MAIEIVDLPMNSIVILHSYVSLPEGMASVMMCHGLPKDLEETVKLHRTTSSF